MPRYATAIRSTAAVKRSGSAIRRESFIQMLLKNPGIPFAFCLTNLRCDPHAKIDWDAYMSQVRGFLGGERDYSKLEGDTGPLVYPAGFLYIYSAIKFLTGGEVYPAQILSGFMYVVNLGLVLFIYLKTKAGAVSVKMNVLLYVPPLLVLLLKAMDISGVVSDLAGTALVQLLVIQFLKAFSQLKNVCFWLYYICGILYVILIGLPFILSYPVAYTSREPSIFFASSSIFVAVFLLLVKRRGGRTAYETNC